VRRRSFGPFCLAGLLGLSPPCLAGPSIAQRFVANDPAALNDYAALATPYERKRVAKELVTFLSHADPRARGRAASALGFIGPLAKDAVPDLSQALDDDDGQVRAKAAEALGNIGSLTEDAALALVLAAGADEERKVRLTADAAILKLHMTTFPPLVRAIWTRLSIPGHIRRLGHKDPKVRDRASKALVQIGSLALGPLRKALVHKKPAVRRNAALTLRDMQALTIEAVPALLECLQDDEPILRYRGAVGLGMLFPPATKEVIAALALALDDPMEYVREEAASALGKAGPDAKDAVPALVRLLGRRSTTLTGPPLPVPVPIVPYDCKQAKKALASIGPASVPALVSALEGGDGQKEADALDVLAYIVPRPREAVPAIVRKMERTQSPDVWEQARYALAMIGTPEAIAAQERLVPLGPPTGARKAGGE